MNPPQHPGARWAALRALRHRNYRLYFFGQAVSLLGTWVQTVAQGWLVYRLTGSTLLLGTVAFASQAPQLLLGPLGGILADRHDRRRLMLTLQSLMLLQAATLAVLTALGLIAPWHIVALALFLGAVNSLDAPVRQSMAAELVGDRADLPNAVALNSITFNSARFVGPPLAGLILAWTSEAACFALNALSFAAVLAALSRIRTVPATRLLGSFAGAFREGLSYAWRTYPVRALLTQVGLVSVLAAPYVALMPVFARDVFGSGPRALGWLLGAAGLGALMAALFLALRRSVRGLSGTIALGGGLAGAALLAFSLAGELAVALPLLFLLGFGIIVTNVSCNTVLQTIVPDGMRGRVVALYATAVLGGQALGNLAAGWLAEHLGAPRAESVLALLLLAAAAWFVARLPVLRRHLRGIYGELGVPR